MKYSITVIFLLALSIFLNSCGSGDKPDNLKQQPPAKITVQPPFRFHKAIEVKPGLTLDVVSWGRGSESVGAYLILRSDSTHLKYRSLSGELDGKIVDVWNMDMDSDGNPELYIQAQGEGEGSHLNMYVYEYSENGSSEKINFPNLSNSSKKGYKGGDSLYIKDDKLMREFPVANADENNTKPSPEVKKVLQYGLRNNSFTVDEVKEKEQTNN
ncbi:MAG: hypothetical protein H7096_01035 [Flavobacterium sp.]|nr:hypothetical protein [Pedobacter sp.]